MRHICQMCGAGEDDKDPYLPSKNVKIVILSDCKTIKISSDIKNKFNVLCENCYSGLMRINIPPRPGHIQLLSFIRRATIDDQQAVMEWLLAKFNLQAKPKKK